jgi:hypothetical protein
MCIFYICTVHTYTYIQLNKNSMLTCVTGAGCVLAPCSGCITYRPGCTVYGFSIGVSLVMKGEGLDVFCIPLAKWLAVELEIICVSLGVVHVSRVYH